MAKKQKDPEKGIPRLRGNLKLKYAAAYYEYEATVNKLAAANAHLRELALMPEHRAVFRALAQQGHHTQEVVKLRDKAALVGAEICKKFDIPEVEWGHYVVDTETGKLTKITGDKDNG